MKSWTKPTSEHVEKVLNLVRSETDRIYFFSKLANPLWLPILNERGYFNACPDPERLANGNIRFPYWPELQYLKNICVAVPDRVVDILLDLPQTDNRSVYRDILAIALKMHPDKSVRLAPKVNDLLGSIKHPNLYNLMKVLGHWAQVASFDQLKSILSRLFEFSPDPEADDKIRRRKEDPEDFFTLLEPQPFMHSHDYKRFIEKALPPLLQTMPYELAELLIKTTAQMIDLKTHPEQKRDKDYKDDLSEIWCRRLVDNDDSLDRSQELVVQALTFSCEAVYERCQQNMQELDQQLQKQRWKVFERIRLHLFGKYPEQADKDAVRKFVLEYPHYAEYEYRFEFYQMLRAACAHFGDDLLTEKEREDIYKKILSGPSKSRFMEWLGDQYTEEQFKERRDHFQRKQLLPFRPVLFGKYKDRLQELEKLANEVISDEDYSPVGRPRSGTVSHVSPKPKDELSNMSDGDLLNYINSWNDSHYEEDDVFKEINITALSLAFQRACSEVIFQTPERLDFWMRNYKKINRPVFVKSIISAMHRLVKDGSLQNLSTYFQFCSEILELPQENEKTSYQSDESDAEPRDWTSSRRAVCDLVEECLKKSKEVSAKHGDQILELLKQLCLQSDLRMDSGQSVIDSEEREPFTDAINMTRGRAWEQLFEFTKWKRSHDESANLSEVWDIIRERFNLACQLPIRLPEYAMLGRCFVMFFILKQQSIASELKPAIFPRENKDAWSAAFANFLAGSRPHPAFLEFFKDDYLLAIEQFGSDLHVEWDQLNLISLIGDRLFIYYLWDIVQLDAPDTLLKRYYESTEFDRTYWDKLFDSAGRMFGETETPPPDMMGRIQSFVKWRVNVGRKKELVEFISWLEAKSLDQRWLLETFSEILDVIADEEFETLFTFEALERNIETCLDLALDCLQKITAKSVHIDDEPVRKILEAGFASKDPKTLENARRCRENLLKRRYFQFLELKD